jgi:endo-1,4-beta-xylanase
MNGGGHAQTMLGLIEKRNHLLFGVAALGVTALAFSGCSTGSSGEGGSSGASTGGAGGTGGNSGPGGTGGGLPGTGGTLSSGGLSSSAGAAAKGGSAATGGSAGAGGSSAAGGATELGGSGGMRESTAGAGMTGTGGMQGGSGGAGGASNAGGVSGKGGNGGSGGARAGSGGSGGGTAGAANTCPPATPLTGGKQYCSNSKGNAGGNYAYELWSSGTGTGCMTVYGKDATFSSTWTKVDDLLARIGLGFDQSKTPSQIGTISCDFAETKTNDAGLVYVGIYGWTVSPLREYYIIDDWGDTKPADTASDGTPRTHVGTIMVDDSAYDVWKHTQVNKPAITGDGQTFDQYFSVRATARQCGHISISEHFSQWMGLGLDLGKLEEAKLLLEAQDSTGTIAFTTATVVVK